jgi:hypothetical protein
VRQEQLELLLKGSYGEEYSCLLVGGLADYVVAGFATVTLNGSVEAKGLLIAAGETIGMNMRESTIRHLRSTKTWDSGDGNCNELNRSQ